MGYLCSSVRDWNNLLFLVYINKFMINGHISLRLGKILSTIGETLFLISIGETLFLISGELAWGSKNVCFYRDSIQPTGWAVEIAASLLCIKMSFDASVHALQTRGSMDGLLNNELGADATGYSIQYDHAATWALLERTSF